MSEIQTSEIITEFCLVFQTERSDFGHLLFNKFKKLFWRLTVQCKLMRLDRPPAKIQSKSDSNWLLINFYDPNLAVRSSVATISIRNPDYLDGFKSNPISVAAPGYSDGGDSLSSSSLVLWAAAVLTLFLFGKVIFIFVFLIFMQHCLARD